MLAIRHVIEKGHAMKAKHRRRLFVDPEVQGALVARCLVYWCLCLFVVFASLLTPDFIFASLGLVSPTGPGIWVRYSPGLLLAGTLTPMMVLDLLRCTNRFAGPMVRMRRFLRGLANGEEVKPMRFRRGDYWRGYADDLNAVLKRIETLEAKLAAVTAQPSNTFENAALDGYDLADETHGAPAEESAEVSGEQRESDLVYSH